MDSRLAPSQTWKLRLQPHHSCTGIKWPNSPGSRALHEFLNQGDFCLKTNVTTMWGPCEKTMFRFLTCMYSAFQLLAMLPAALPPASQVSISSREIPWSWLNSEHWKQFSGTIYLSSNHMRLLTIPYKMQIFLALHLPLWKPTLPPEYSLSPHLPGKPLSSINTYSNIETTFTKWSRLTPPIKTYWYPHCHFCFTCTKNR